MTEIGIAALIGGALSALGAFFWQRRKRVKAKLYSLLDEAEAAQDQLGEDREAVAREDAGALRRRRVLIKQIERAKEDIRDIKKNTNVTDAEIDERERRLGIIR